MSRTPYRLLALSLAIALTVSACGGGEQEGPQGGPGQVTVATLKAEQVGLTRELPGRTNAFLVAEVRPQVNGIVAKRLFTEGGLVTAGQP
ncbi:efflux transporter periplasmic adaptor subunit, partial [Stenotrophomonas sp. TWI809]